MVNVSFSNATTVNQSEDELTKLERRIGGLPKEIDKNKVGHYGLGKPSTQAEIDGWDIDIRPDGKGLPEGSGSAYDGEEIYQNKCAVCHGEFGEGVGRWPKLAGGFDTLEEDRPEKTVGSYWPYASTLWDYIHRAMPFQQPQSLSNNEVYSLTAYVLYMNDIIDDDFTIDKTNLHTIEMPNKDGFFEDVRPDSVNTICMKDCKDKNSIKVTWDASDLGVTPVAHLQDEPAKLAPKANSKPENLAGKKVYDGACGVCHNSGIAGAPTIKSNIKDWNARVAQGNEVLFLHAIKGFQGDKGMMPAKGGQMHLSDEDVKAAVLYMVSEGSSK